ncbi:hypothetical protein E2I00_017253, partial [Balaenoptera physalus]
NGSTIGLKGFLYTQQGARRVGLFGLYQPGVCDTTMWFMLHHLNAFPMSPWDSVEEHLITVEEKDPAFWNRQAAQALDVAKKLQPIQTAAKNLILFLGDGLSVPPPCSPETLGCRQTQGGPGDSGLTQGVPTGMGVPTVTATRILKGQMNGRPGAETPLAMDQFPYLALSKTYNVDRQVPDSAGTATAYLCGVKANMKTIGVSAAARYNECSTVRGNEVMSVMNRAKKAGRLGASFADPEYPGDASQNGTRKDRKNLVQEWQAKYQVTGARLFEPADMKYEAQRDHTKDPSLQEMTEAALRVLSRNPRGFYLFVEGVAYRALTEAVMFDNAIAAASQLTREADTLILVTADHSHVFSFGGYTLRGSSVFGLGFGKATDGKSYTSILYGNGPGYALGGASRPDTCKFLIISQQGTPSSPSLAWAPQLCRAGSTAHLSTITVSGSSARLQVQGLVDNEMASVCATDVRSPAAPGSGDITTTSPAGIHQAEGSLVASWPVIHNPAGREEPPPRGPRPLPLPLAPVASFFVPASSLRSPTLRCGPISVAGWCIQGSDNRDFLNITQG